MTLVLDSLTVNGGAFDIDVDGDGIQADTALTINNGTIDIQTWKGYSTWDDTLAEAYSCKGGTWSHNWDNGSTADGVTTYTCSTCSATETQTVAESASVDACSHTALHDSEETDATEETDEGFTATFAGDAGVASIDVYYTSDYTSVSENVYEKSTGKKASKATLAKGKTMQLKATMTKVAKKLTLKTHRKVTWESSNKRVATVTSNGKVKAVGKGTCNVYAYARNGVYSACTVVVK